MRIDHDALIVGAGGAGLWAALERTGKAADVRKALLDVTMIRR